MYTEWTYSRHFLIDLRLCCFCEFRLSMCRIVDTTPRVRSARDVVPVTMATHKLVLRATVSHARVRWPLRPTSALLTESFIA